MKNLMPGFLRATEEAEIDADVSEAGRWTVLKAQRNYDRRQLFNQGRTSIRSTTLVHIIRLPVCPRPSDTAEGCPSVAFIVRGGFRCCKRMEESSFIVIRNKHEAEPSDTNMGTSAGEPVDD